MNRDKFFHMLPERPADELLAIQSAYWLSKTVHREQWRDGGERYFEHPRRVALNLIAHGHADTDTLIVALLHDVVEDTTTPPLVIINMFGLRIWNHLVVISKNIPRFDPRTGEVIAREAKPVEQYYAEIGKAELLVRLNKCADRLDNLNDMSAFEMERRRRYLEETRKYLIPTAKETSAQYAYELEACCASAEHAIRIEQAT
jgi:(p)ppGpp synthase/HD superfamily hydrolase